VTTLVPQPGEGDVPFNEPVSVELDTGEQAEISFRPVQQVTELILPILAASKYQQSTYEIRVDGETVYGPAEIPPTDVDDLTVTFLPAHRFSRELTVFITNLSPTIRTYHVQPIGWEPAGGTA
jgi:hypothetical protein